MSSKRSDLYNSRYGYDMVLATTQESINATMKKYLYGLDGTIAYVLVVAKPGSKGKEFELISWEDLSKKIDNGDPFSIPDGADAEKNPLVAALYAIEFAAGIKITMGFPKNFENLKDVPDVIGLRDSAEVVDYRMLCADMQIVELTTNRAWTTISRVNLRMDKGSKEFNELPKHVQEKHKNLSGSMFDVSQLLFDLNNAKLSTVPEVEGLDPGSMAAVALSRYFCGVYFQALKKKGEPILNYTVKNREQRATFAPTDLNFHVNPLVAEKEERLKTLNYLMSTSDRPVGPGVDFTWDWMSAEDAKQAHGVIAISRYRFADHLRDMLIEQARKYCYRPWCRVTSDALAMATYYAAGRSSDRPGIYYTNNSDSSENGKIMAYYLDNRGTQEVAKVKFYDRTEDQAGLGGSSGSMTIEVWYEATAQAAGNCVYIRSSMKVRVYLRFLQDRIDHNITDKDYRDRFELAVDDQGKMKSIKTTVDWNDHSNGDGIDKFRNFFTNINSVWDSLKAKFESSNFDGIKLAELDAFIFPGGNTFAFKNFNFSDNQDLLCAITYVNPT